MNRIKIMVVEDDVFISQDIREYLENMDYEVSGVAYDAEDAYKLLLTHTPKPRLTGYTSRRRRRWHQHR